MAPIPKYLLNRREAPIAFSQAGYDKLVAEKGALETERPDAVKHLKLAREMGDLSENGYYKAARQRLSFIDFRLRRLTNILRRAKIVQSANAGFVDVGSTVTLTIEGHQVTYIIVSGYESDPKNRAISYISPLGKALMGKKPGDTVSVHAPAGEKVYTIAQIT